MFDKKCAIDIYLPQIFHSLQLKMKNLKNLFDFFVLDTIHQTDIYNYYLLDEIYEKQKKLRNRQRTRQR